MKFTVTLVYALTALLLFGLFGAYIYLTVIGEQIRDQSVMTAANIVLFLFAMAVIITSLAVIWLENSSDSSEHPTRDNLTSEPLEENRNVEHYSEQFGLVMHELNEISQSISLTNKTLNLGLERLSTRIDEVENIFLDSRLNSFACDDDEKQNERSRQKLAEIFNNDLAETLSDLEIMKDTQQPEKAPGKYEEIDLDTLLDAESEKK